MRKTLLALTVLFATQSAWAGVEYEFVQSTQSDIEQMPATQLTGRAVIDGDRSRVDFVSGNVYAPGAYVVSTNGSRTMYFVDPVTKSYSEVNAAAVAAAYGAQNVQITNLKTNVEKLPDSTSVAGVPTTHYLLRITYDVTLAYGSLMLRQNVREDIEKWVTPQFGDVADNFFAGGVIRTGNAELDKVIDAEMSLIKGFPMRQKTTIVTTDPRGVAPGSQLRMHATRTQQQDLEIQKIRRVTADASMFKIPVAFQKVDGSQVKATSQPKVTVLSFDDEKKQ